MSASSRPRRYSTVTRGPTSVLSTRSVIFFALVTPLPFALGGVQKLLRSLHDSRPSRPFTGLDRVIPSRADLMFDHEQIPHLSVRHLDALRVLLLHHGRFHEPT